jgi:hypothetical protein
MSESIYKKVPGACFCLNLVHMLHLSKKRNTSCEGFALTAGGERDNSISPILSLRSVRCLSSHGFSVHDTLVHKLGHKL